MSAPEFKKFPTSLRHCNNCKLLYRHPTTSEHESKAFYEKEYYQPGLTTDLPNSEALKKLIKSNFAGSEKDFSRWLPLIHSISKKLNKKIRVLDYGANWGYTAHQLNEQEYIEDALAYEYSSVRSAFGAKNLNIKYVNENEFSQDFDLVFSSHAIEHMHNPSIFKKHMDKLLPIGGYCIVTCPNGSLTAMINKSSGWRKLWGEAHPNFISDEFLLNQFNNYEGAIFREDLSDLKNFDYLNHLSTPPASFLPISSNLIGVFRRTTLGSNPGSH
ncbi:class I SAM-dependent methyltransferase [Novosphingobium beihaiensis]|uniref:Class I SAM-dependent methyltransferase n=1 Tax=Novosphingobium beihaiensis TaxID=2930389 RepID=A0ABT0BKV6_9SPHN|nr:methyltransferase domain-containing protein [Novosphingobium beihaiensis]MCJ2185695.1 class I SAM-dependent methyltransferase [Novosphingobium beihaiensis]